MVISEILEFDYFLNILKSNLLVLSLKTVFLRVI